MCLFGAGTRVRGRDGARADRRKWQTVGVEYADKSVNVRCVMRIVMGKSVWETEIGLLESCGMQAECREDGVRAPDLVFLLNYQRLFG